MYKQLDYLQIEVEFPCAIRLIGRLLSGKSRIFERPGLKTGGGYLRLWKMFHLLGDNPGDLLHPASSRNLLAEGRWILRIIPTEYRLIGKRRMSWDEPGSNLQNSRSLRCVRRVRAISNRHSDGIWDIGGFTRADKFIPFCNNAAMTSLTLRRSNYHLRFEGQFCNININASTDYKHAISDAYG